MSAPSYVSASGRGSAASCINSDAVPAAKRICRSADDRRSDSAPPFDEAACGNHKAEMRKGIGGPLRRSSSVPGSVPFRCEIRCGIPCSTDDCDEPCSFFPGHAVNYSQHECRLCRVGCVSSDSDTSLSEEVEDSPRNRANASCLASSLHTM